MLLAWFQYRTVEILCALNSTPAFPVGVVAASSIFTARQALSTLRGCLMWANFRQIHARQAAYPLNFDHPA